MIARLLQLTTLSGILLAVLWMSVCFWLERPFVGAAGLLVMALGHSAILGVELVLMNRFQRQSGFEKLHVADLLIAWLAESWCSLRVFLWRQPFRAKAFPDNIADAERRRGLLLVHGFVCNRGVWNSWYPRLLSSGIPYIGLSLEPAFGGIDEYARPINEAIERLICSTGLPPVVVAHSMGGLAVRAWLRVYGPEALQKIHRVVTLGSPHQGTALAKFDISLNVHQMAIDSSWLRSLLQNEPPGSAERFLCIFSRCDNVVFPAQTACLPGAETAEITRCAHIQLIDHPTSYRIVYQTLMGTKASAADGSVVSNLEAAAGDEQSCDSPRSRPLLRG